MNAKTGFVLAEPYIYGDETTYILELIDYDEEVLYYLLGVLNSRFFDWCFREFYAGGGIEGEVKLFAFKQFPIPKVEANRSLAKEIIDTVKLVYKHKDISCSGIIEDFVLKLYDSYSAYWYIYS
jgi:hypothetical protein